MGVIYNGGAPRRNQQGGEGAAATAAQQPSTEGGLRLEPLEAKRSETGGWTHRTPEPAPRLVWVQH